MKKLFIMLALSLGFTVCSVFLIAQYFEVKTSDAISASLLEEGTVLHSAPSETLVYSRNDLKIDLPENFEKVARKALSEIPESQTRSLKKIVADYDAHARRGLASYKSMYLGVSSIQSEAEFRRVFIHELGHVVDLGGLRASKKMKDSGFRDGSNIIYETDPSLAFYTLCWKNESMKNNLCSEKDFVSGYASSDVFEDFAESYLLFVENNQAFVRLAKTSPVLQKKYDFFAHIVFQDVFQSTPDFSSPQTIIWDVTKIN